MVARTCTRGRERSPIRRSRGRAPAGDLAAGRSRSAPNAESPDVPGVPGSTSPRRQASPAHQGRSPQAPRPSSQCKDAPCSPPPRSTSVVPRPRRWHRGPDVPGDRPQAVTSVGEGCSLAPQTVTRALHSRRNAGLPAWGCLRHRDHSRGQAPSPCAASRAGTTTPWPSSASPSTPSSACRLPPSLRRSTGAACPCPWPSVAP